MSASEMARPAAGSVVWLGYGLAVAGTALAVVATIGPSGTWSELLAVAAIAVALAVLGLAVWAPAAFEVTSSRSRTRVVNFLLLLPSAALMVAGFTSPLVYPPVVVLTGAAGCAIAVLAGLWAPRVQPAANPTFFYLFLALYGTGCGVGAPALINRSFDRSPGQIYQAAVEARRVTGGRGGPSYSLKLGPWGPRTGPSYVPVTRGVYDATQPGDTACVSLHPGALHMPWYLATRC
jgi:hypothetical protein